MRSLHHLLTGEPLCQICATFRTLSIANAAAACFTWFALCFWYQSVFASLHRIVRNGSQSAADVLDWRYNLLIASGSEAGFDSEMSIRPEFEELFYATSQRLWPEAVQSAAVAGTGSFVLFAITLLVAAHVSRDACAQPPLRLPARITLTLAILAGISSAAVAWYVAVPRLALFSTSYLPNPASLPAILATSLWHLVIICPLFLALAAARVARANSNSLLSPSPSDQPIRLCPQCGYNAGQFHRCPECGLPSNRFHPFNRSRIIRLLAIPTCTLLALLIPALLLATYATDPKTHPPWALRASVWLRLRHTELLVTGQHILPKFDLVTQVTLANGEQWDVLPFFAISTDPVDLQRNPGGGLWEFLVTRTTPFDSGATATSAIVGFPNTLANNPWKPGFRRYNIRLSNRADHPDQAIVGTIRLDARVTSLSTRPMRPLDFTQQPPPSDSSIEAQLARTLAERKWIWYPAIPKP